MQRIPDDSSIFIAEAKAVDLDLDFIRICDGYVPGETRKKFMKPIFGIWKESKMHFLKFNKIYYNNKIIIHQSNGKYLYNQRKSNLQYLIW